ncbi:ankyrin domain protein [Rhodopirellula europaea 6C]|uniref:Ankyrin domain protein n=1 Tax=Rhodopirellula europaea 6C TaxID=1263867 RepID=M2ACY9_9BACT|nr:ankyrin domain protein [Rhodopirellula europaea 6C]
MNVAGKTPLHWAVTKGFQYLSIELIESGADINKATPQGDQPLHIAARRGDIPMINALLKAGASVTATNNTGYTSLHEAASAGHTQAAQLMIDSGRIGYHERSILLPRVRRAAELHGHAATAEAIRAAEGGRERAEPPRELA